MADYLRHTWVDRQYPPGLGAVELNEIEDELVLQAADAGVAYTRTNWINGRSPYVTDASPLNNIENGIAAVAAAVGLSYTKTTWNAGWTPPRDATRLNKIEAQLVSNRLKLDAPSPSSGRVYSGARIDSQFYIQHASIYGVSGTPPDPPQNGSGPIQDLFEAHAGKKISAVHTGTGGNAWPPNAFQTVQATNARARHCFLNYSFGTTAAGLQNILNPTTAIWTTLGNWFQAVKNVQHPILFRPFWEMNLSQRFDWSSGKLTSAADYVTIWRNLWHACADVMGGFTPGSGLGTNTGNVSFFWCCNRINAGDPTSRYPGDQYVDWVGWDAYAQGTTWQSVTATHQATYDFCAALSTKPLAIGETGCNPDIGSPGKAAWVTDFLENWIPNNPRLKLFSWFNEAGSPNLPHIEVGDGSGVIYKPDTPNQVLAPVTLAWQRGIASDYYLADVVNNGITFTNGQKVPVPA